jgi:hypothetical protein
MQKKSRKGKTACSPAKGFSRAKELGIESGAKEVEEQSKPLFLAMVNLRFALHAPAPISESNADIVLNNNRIAVWNCSLVKFATEKKPIEMKAVF